MISSLHGTVVSKTKTTATIVVGGVGFEVHVTPTHAASLKDGALATLSTHLHVREDALELYGFRNTEELAFFKELITVSGVGPRSALGILTLGSVAEIRAAIGRGDLAYLTKVAGIGRKTAERIVVELKEKISAHGAVSVGGEKTGDVLSDVIDALVSLGYRVDEARTAARKVAAEGKNAEAALKEALSHLSRT